jgi:hypothetical protein
LTLSIFLVKLPHPPRLPLMIPPSAIKDTSIFFVRGYLFLIRVVNKGFYSSGFFRECTPPALLKRPNEIPAWVMRDENHYQYEAEKSATL